MFNRRRNKNPGQQAEALAEESVARIRDRYQELVQRAGQANQLITAGRYGAAEQLLTATEQLALEFVSEHSFLVFRMLGQCARVNQRLEDARGYYGRAFQLATEFDRIDTRLAIHARSIAIAGFASVALAEADLAEADELYGMAVELTRQVGPSAELAAVLQAHAMVMHRLRDDRAADLYREALGQDGLSAEVRGIILDNLGQELDRQGKPAEAVEHARQAAATLAEAAAPHHRYTALFNLAEIARGVDPTASVEAFKAAHDLIHQLHERVDVEHYTTGYRRRLKAIAEEVTRRAADPDSPLLSHPDFDAMLRILVAERSGHGLTVEGLRYGFAQVTATQSLAEGERLIVDRRYADAEPRLRMAELIWQHLGAQPELLKAWAALGGLHVMTGQTDRARTLLEQARQEAHRLGDAQTEANALIGLCSLAAADGWSSLERNSLELLAEARALLTFIAERDGRDLGDVDGGAVDKMESQLCQVYGAFELAEQHLRRAIAAVEGHADKSGEPRLLGVWVIRLCQLIGLLADQGRFAETAPIREQLLLILASTAEPSLRYPINITLGKTDLRGGQWCEPTLQRFRDGCAAFEELNPGVFGLAETYQLASSAAGDYLTAAELALHLGHTREAFQLLERAKSRALLRAFADQQPSAAAAGPLLAEEGRLWNDLQRLRSQISRATRADSDDPRAPHERLGQLYSSATELTGLRARLTAIWEELSDDQPQVRAHRLAESITAAEVASLLAPGRAALVEFFVGERAVHAFTVSRDAVTARRIADTDDPDLRDLVGLLFEDSPSTMNRILTNPGFARLTAVIEEAAQVAEVGPVYVVPHQNLHLAPLHLTVGPDGSPRPRPRTFLLPSASVLRATYIRRPEPRPGRAVIGGDPLGDLPFARSECVHAAGRLGVSDLQLGAQVTANWLASALGQSEPVRLLHLACHAEFNEWRPQRCGLLLAGRNGEPDLVTLSRLSRLNWSGVLVVLSACQSGRHRVDGGDELAGLGRTLLAAGAAALVTSFRPVPDLATALLMTWFYDQLDIAAPLDVHHVGRALAGAQLRLRDATARDLITWAARDAHTGDERTTLACRVLATAHRTARNLGEYATWQGHVTRRLNGGDPPPAQAWSRQPTIAADPAYRVRPFAGPANWASFSVFGAGNESLAGTSGPPT